MNKLLYLLIWPIVFLLQLLRIDKLIARFKYAYQRASELHDVPFAERNRIMADEIARREYLQ